MLNSPVSQASSWRNARAIRYTNGKRIVELRCGTCGKTWDVSQRGRETGFICAAADSHVSLCKYNKLVKDGVISKDDNRA